MIVIAMPIGSHTEPKTDVCVTDLELFAAVSARHQAAALSNNQQWVEQRAAELGTERLRVVGLPIAKARNDLTMAALAKPKMTHLLFIDSDMGFTRDALARLAARRLPIIGGLYFNRRSPFQPQLHRRHDASLETGQSLGFVYDYPRNALVEVDGTGGGFLLIERRVLESIPYGTWWTETDGESEDLAFCRRAQAAGFRIVVDTGLRLDHYVGNDITVNEDFVDRFRRGSATAGNGSGHGHHRHNVWTGPRFRRAKLPKAAEAALQLEQPSDDPPSQHPAISVVISTRDTPAKYLRAAINSALDQDYANDFDAEVEVIVVDDGTVSPDAIPDGVKLIRLSAPGSRRGLGEALNTGLREAKAEWLYVLLPTDMAHPERVHVQLQAASATGFDVVTCCLDTHINENKHSWISPNIPRWSTLEEQARALAGISYVQPSSLMFHRSALQKVGSFSAELETMFIWDWTRRATEAGIFIYQVADTLGFERKGLGVRLDQSEVKRVVELAEERRLARDAAAATARADYEAGIEKTKREDRGAK